CETIAEPGNYLAPRHDPIPREGHPRAILFFSVARNTPAPGNQFASTMAVPQGTRHSGNYIHRTRITCLSLVLPVVSDLYFPRGLRYDQTTDFRTRSELPELDQLHIPH